MKKFCNFLVSVLLALLLGGSAFGYAGKIYISHNAITNARLGSLDNLVIEVYTVPVDQNGYFNSSPGSKPNNYNIEKNGTYQSESYVVINVLSSGSGVVYCLLKGNGRYSIVSASLGDPIGPDQFIRNLKSYKLGQPDPPSIDRIVAGYETAKASISYSPEYDYSKIEVAVWDNEGKFYLKDRQGNETTFVSGYPSEYGIGFLVDGRTLETDADGHSYKFYTRAYVLGVPPSSWGNADFVTLSLGLVGPQTFILTLESGVPEKPGINFFAMPFKKPWYVFKIDRTPILWDGTTNEVTNAYALAKAINMAAGTNAVSTFGRWDRKSEVQKDVGVLVKDGNLEGVISELGKILLQEGEGYQVYISGIRKVELLIKNTPTP